MDAPPRKLMPGGFAELSNRPPAAGLKTEDAFYGAPPPKPKVVFFSKVIIVSFIFAGNQGKLTFIVRHY